MPSSSDTDSPYSSSNHHLKDAESSAKKSAELSAEKSTEQAAGENAEQSTEESAEQSAGESVGWRWSALSSQHKGMVLAVLSALGFSMKAIFVKLAYLEAPVDAITLLSIRMFFALPMFLIIGFAALRSGPALTQKDWGWLIFLGLTGYYGASILDFMGLEYISSGLERVILFIYPTLVVLMGVVFLGQRFNRKILWALLLSYAGIALVFFSDLRFSEQSSDIWLGAGLVFASAVSYACYSGLSESTIKRLGSMRFSVLAMMVSICAVQVHYLIAHPVANLVQPLPVYLYGLAMALFSTVLPVLFQSSAIRYIGAARTVLIGMLGPVMTILAGWWLLSEPVSAIQLVGTALVLAGIYQVKHS